MNIDMGVHKIMYDAKMRYRMAQYATEFINESNKIEGILREATVDEIKEHHRFMLLPIITINDVQDYVKVYQPGAIIRDKKGLDVTIGEHTPEKGGENIIKMLSDLLILMPRITPYEFHCKYENLHPFTDCNGRSGRILWAWSMKNQDISFKLGFLHTFYYQTLEYYSG